MFKHLLFHWTGRRCGGRDPGDRTGAQRSGEVTLLHLLNAMRRPRCMANGICAIRESAADYLCESRAFPAVRRRRHVHE